MKKLIYFLAVTLTLLFCVAFTKNNPEKWIPLFDGKSLKDWKVGEHSGTFTVENGMIVAHGETAHLF